MCFGHHGGQAPLSVRIHAAWLLTVDDKVEVNKVALVDQAVRDSNTSVPYIAWDPYMDTEWVQML